MPRSMPAIARFPSSAISNRRSAICGTAARACCSKRTTRCDTMRPPVSALIHTLNERDTIGDCIRSVEWADGIYLLDSFSTDGTIELVGEQFPRVRIEQREYLGAAAQKNYGI